MTERRRILIVSLGSIGQRHLRNTRAMLPEADIAVYRQHALPGGDPPPGADAIFFDRTAALEFRPDAVIVASPASEHIGCSVPFAERGANMFIEKPIADTGHDIDQLRSAARRGGGFAMVGYVLRFQPALHYIRQSLAEGIVGAVRTARIQVGQYLPDWRPDADYRDTVSAQRELGGGALLELSHEIDYAMWLFGKPKSLWCSTATVSDLEIDVEDSAHLLFEYGDERRVALQLDFLQRVPKMTIEVVGSEGTLDADLIDESATLSSPTAPNGAPLPVPHTADGNEIYLRQFDLFFSKCFEDYGPSFRETTGFTEWVDIDHGADVVRIVDLARQASRRGTRMAVEEMTT